MHLEEAKYYLLRLPTLPNLSIDKEKIRAEQQLYKLWQETALSEAVFVASPSLYNQINNHLNTNSWPLPEALLRSLWKYALRMSTRATPFGLMAAVSVGKVSNKTQVILEPQHRFIRHQRLDMDCVAALVRQVIDDPALRAQLRFFPNNSLYTIGDELRYTERDNVDTERHYFISTVSNSDYLKITLQHAASGATLSQLVTVLADFGLSADAATVFLEQLIENQLIYSELEPILTGPPMLSQLQKRLYELKGNAYIVKALTHIDQALRSDTANPIQLHQTVREALEEYAGVFPVQNLIQTDVSVITPVNQINNRVIQTILRQIKTLLPLNRSKQSSTIVEFVRRFRERYDRREMPLLTVLDSDYGIGYSATSEAQSDYAPLLNGLSFPEINDTSRIAWGRYENLLLTKLSQALQTGYQSVELTDNDLKLLADDPVHPLPSSFYLFGNLLGASAEAIDQGNFTFNLLAADGPSAANLLGRFCAHSSELTGYVQASLRKEEQQRPDAVFAEIIHWPDDRLGNILVRPTLRVYEIPYVSQPSVEAEHTILLADLLVSVQEDGRVRLRSKRLNKEVIPRLSTAHNYRTGLSTYQFLADLQWQYGSMHISWNWGVLQDQPFLPRITYKNIILTRARWTLHQVSLPVDSADQLITYLLANYRLPRWIAIAEGDNELVLDLDTSVGQQLLLEEVRRHKVIRLIEWIATSDQCWIREGQDAYVSELVIPCETHANTVAAASTPTLNTKTSLLTTNSRSFDSGSDWLYIKLYSGTQIADELLKTIIGPLVQELKSQQIIQLSFFIRYADPEPHIRLHILNGP